LEWPRCGACSALLGFAAQIDFCHPRFRENARGDVLTFHYCMRCWPWSASEDGGSLTWHTVCSSDAVIDWNEVPPLKEGVRLTPLFGTPHETIDHPAPSEGYGGGLGGESYTYLYFTLQGTKIGGLLPPIQPLEVPRDARGRSMTFLATIGPTDGLLWGDMGSVFIWMSADGPEMTWAIESY
jgi:hypothetical protein